MLWVFWFHQTLGIVSLDEGHRSCAEYATAFERGPVYLTAATLFPSAASSAILALHFLGPVREARLSG